MATAQITPIAPKTRRAAAPKKLLVADLFCGAGGSSTGARRALKSLGLEMVLTCVNHWPVAIATHQANHPDARHYCQDVAAVRPPVVVPEGKLDLLMASPTCTFHSRARGGKPTSDQQRMDPWHIITWLTELRVRCMIIENVPEFISWGPVNARTGKPIKSKRGEYFLAWTRAIEALGFKIEWRILNAADYGDATTRQRFFLIARSDGKPLRWPEPTHAKDPAADLFGSREKWRPAREIIDWAIPGKSIFGRKKPLSPKTLARIYAGAVKFNWPEPFLVILRNHMDGQSVDGPLPSITAGGTHIALAQPVVISTRQSRGGPAPRSAEEPLPTLVATDSRVGVAQPILCGNRSNNAAKSADDPVPTLTTATGGGVFLAEPLMCAHRSGSVPQPTEAPVPTITKSGNVFLVEPFILSQHAGGAPRSTDDPVPGMTCDGAHALIAPYYGSGSGQTCKSVDAPLDTVTTHQRFGLVTPVTHDDTSNRARSIDEPLPTITKAPRGELAFIAAAFGERPGQAPRVHDIAEPCPTICAEGRVQLVEPGRDFDILFRMLEPHELAAAMGFSDEESRYEFVGNKTEITAQIGNAVPVNTATALVAALIGE